MCVVCVLCVRVVCVCVCVVCGCECVCVCVCVCVCGTFVGALLFHLHEIVQVFCRPE